MTFWPGNKPTLIIGLTGGFLFLGALLVEGKAEPTGGTLAVGDLVGGFFRITAGLLGKERGGSLGAGISEESLLKIVLTTIFYYSDAIHTDNRYH